MPPLAGVAEETLNTPDTEHLVSWFYIRTWHVKQSLAVLLSVNSGHMAKIVEVNFIAVDAIGAFRFGLQLH